MYADGVAVKLVAKAFLVYLLNSFPEVLLLDFLMANALHDHFAKKLVAEKRKIVVHDGRPERRWWVVRAKLLLVSIPELVDRKVTDEKDVRSNLVWVVCDPIVEVLDLVRGVVGVKVKLVDAVPVGFVEVEDLSVDTHIAAVVCSPVKAASWGACQEVHEPFGEEPSGLFSMRVIGQSGSQREVGRGVRWWCWCHHSSGFGR